MLCEAYIGGRSQCPDARATDRADHGAADPEFIVVLLFSGKSALSLIALEDDFAVSERENVFQAQRSGDGDESCRAVKRLLGGVDDHDVAFEDAVAFEAIPLAVNRERGTQIVVGAQ